jgi:predicted regulator of Ras-like GTPase activity (Roadblock/LC7/MglB family)
VDAKQALSDLMEISSQVEAAVFLDSAGAVDAAAGTSEAGAATLARAARELLDAAGRVRSAGDHVVTQLEAATREGSLFVVRDGERVIAAATGRSPTVGLVFYDLKTCLRAVATPPEAGAGSQATPAGPVHAVGVDREEDASP